MQFWKKRSALLLELSLLSTMGGCALLYNYDGYSAEAGASVGTGTVGGNIGGAGGTGALGGAGGAMSAGGTPAGGGGAAGGACDAAEVGIFAGAAWVSGTDGPGMEQVSQVAISPGGSGSEIVVVGTFDHEFDFAGETYVLSTSPTSLFTARFDVDGKWMSGAGALFSGHAPGCDARAFGVASDGGSGAFLAGGCFGAIDSSGFAARINGAGNEVWFASSDSTNMVSGDEMLTGVAVNDVGAPHFIGRASAYSLKFNATEVDDLVDKEREIAVISCQNVGCSASTTALLGGPGKDQATAIAVAPDPGAKTAVLLTGSYTAAWPGEADMPVPPAAPDPANTLSATFVKRHSPGGTEWATGFVGESSSIPATCDSAYGEPRGTAIAADGNGNVLVTGWTCYPTRFGKTSSNNMLLPHAGKADVFLAKLDGATGNVIWAKTFGDDADQVGTGIAVDTTTNHVFLAGTFAGTLDFGGSLPLVAPSKEAQSLFVAEFDENGCLIQANKFGNDSEPLESRPVHIAVDAASVVLGGTWSTPLSFGGGELVSGSLSGYVARFLRR